MTSIVEVYRRWPMRHDCIRHLEAVRWGESPTCPYCGAARISRHRELTREDRWQCQRCGRSFAVTVGTIFHRSHVDLQRWFLLIALMLSAKKGLSAMQAARDLDMRRPTVWSMMHRVRKAMADDGALLRGIVEMDETFVGGKPRGRNRRRDDPPGGQGVTGKEPVAGIVERGGRAKMKPITREQMNAADINALVRSMVEPTGSLIHTDEAQHFARLNRFIGHRQINHSEAFVGDDLFNDLYGRIHTNSIESLWAIVKRAIYGQFHHVSRKYLGLYLDEIAWRFNRRHAGPKLDDLLHLAVKP